MDSMASNLSDLDREAIEDSLYECHSAVDRYLDNSRATTEKLLQLNVVETLSLFELLKEELKDDVKFESYKLHLLVPLQVYKLIEMRKRKENGNV